jgi:hypothetical protein
MKELYNENGKSLKKEMQEDTRRWKDIPCSLVSRINIVKMAILLKVIYRFNTMPIKIPMESLSKVENSAINFIWPIHIK